MKLITKITRLNSQSKSQKQEWGWKENQKNKWNILPCPRRKKISQKTSNKTLPQKKNQGHPNQKFKKMRSQRASKRVPKSVPGSVLTLKRGLNNRCAPLKCMKTVFVNERVSKTSIAARWSGLRGLGRRSAGPRRPPSGSPSTARGPSRSSPT